MKKTTPKTLGDIKDAIDLIYTCTKDGVYRGGWKKYGKFIGAVATVMSREKYPALIKGGSSRGEAVTWSWAGQEPTGLFYKKIYKAYKEYNKSHHKKSEVAPDGIVMQDECKSDVIAPEETPGKKELPKGHRLMIKAATDVIEHLAGMAAEFVLEFKPDHICFSGVTFSFSDYDSMEED